VIKRLVIVLTVWAMGLAGMLTSVGLQAGSASASVPGRTSAAVPRPTGPTAATLKSAGPQATAARTKAALAAAETLKARTQSETVPALSGLVSGMPSPTNPHPDANLVTVVTPS
jgi:hypothetical protein